MSSSGSPARGSRPAGPCWTSLSTHIWRPTRGPSRPATCYMSTNSTKGPGASVGPEPTSSPSGAISAASTTLSTSVPSTNVLSTSAPSTSTGSTSVSDNTRHRAHRVASTSSTSSKMADKTKQQKQRCSQVEAEARATLVRASDVAEALLPALAAGPSLGEANFELPTLDSTRDQIGALPISALPPNKRSQ